MGSVPQSVWKGNFLGTSSSFGPPSCIPCLRTPGVHQGGSHPQKCSWVNQSSSLPPAGSQRPRELFHLLLPTCINPALLSHHLQQSWTTSKGDKIPDRVPARFCPHLPHPHDECWLCPHHPRRTPKLFPGWVTQGHGFRSGPEAVLLILLRLDLLPGLQRVKFTAFTCLHPWGKEEEVVKGAPKKVRKIKR